MRNTDSWVWKSGLIAVTLLLPLGPTVASAQSLSVPYHLGINPGDPIWFRRVAQTSLFDVCAGLRME